MCQWKIEYIILYAHNGINKEKCQDSLTEKSKLQNQNT